MDGGGVGPSILSAEPMGQPTSGEEAQDQGRVVGHFVRVLLRKSLPVVLLLLLS